MRTTAILFIAAALCGACGEETIDGFTMAEWEVIAELSPLPEAPHPDPTNRYLGDPLAAELGQRFFFETAYSGPLLVGDDGQNGAVGQQGETGKLSCRSCHLGPWMIDTRSNPPNTSLGSGHMARNAGSLINVAYYPGHWYENDGLLDSIWGESVVDIEFDLGFNSSRLRLAHVIYEKYRDAYNAVFPALDPALDPAAPDAARFPPDARPGTDEWNAMTPEDQAHVTAIMVNFGKALHAYQATLISRDAPFDRYVAGDYQAISEPAKRGLRLFIGKAACVECHSGPALTDGEFHNTGMEPMGEHAVPAGVAPEDWPLGGRRAAIGFVLDYEFNTSSVHSDDRATGRLDELVLSNEDNGKWRSKSLRQVAQTGPYMRTGQMATLREVIEFYNDGGHESGFIGVKDEAMKPLELSEQEMDDLVAFLDTLTGQEVPPELLQDTSLPSN